MFRAPASPEEPDGNLVKEVSKEDFATLLQRGGTNSLLSGKLSAGQERDLFDLLWRYRRLFLPPTRLGEAKLPAHDIARNLCRSSPIEPTRRRPLPYSRK